MLHDLRPGLGGEFEHVAIEAHRGMAEGDRRDHRIARSGGVVNLDAGGRYLEAGAVSRGDHSRLAEGDEHALGFEAIPQLVGGVRRV